MCGRYSFFSQDEVIEKRFSAKIQEPLTRHFNASPSQRLPIITNQNPKAIINGTWGLVPSWMKEEKSFGIINARSESLSEKPSFKNAFKNRRCLIIADGFFEWQKLKDGKQPYRITLKEAGPFAFAGLWEQKKTDDGEQITFSIVTTGANLLVGKIHNRMPVILNPKDEKIWMDNDFDPKKAHRYQIS
jgi:putative SOS response-associated peptidase YedK